MPSVGRYKIIGLCGQRSVEGTRLAAPSENWLCEWGKARRCDFVIRYFPSRKGWRVLDIRNASSWQMPGVRRPMWTGMICGKRYFPTEDAAVMAALHGLT